MPANVINPKPAIVASPAFSPEAPAKPARPLALAVNISTPDGTAVGMLVAQAKTFSTGSQGFYAGDKVTIDGERYQVTMSLVRIGSKPAAK